MRKNKFWILGNGFTLMETMIVIGLFGIIFSAVFSVLLPQREVWYAGLTRQDVVSQASQGLNSMIQELRTSDVAKLTPSVPLNSPTITFSVPVSYDAQGNINWGADAVIGYQIKYSINSTTRQLLRDTLNSSKAVVSTKVLANYCQSLSFTQVSGASRLTITLTTQNTSVTSRTFLQTFVSDVTFRN